MATIEQRIRANEKKKEKADAAITLDKARLKVRELQTRNRTRRR